jgi:hypothetical protein
MTAANSSGSTGLATWVWKPACSAFLRSSARANAVRVAAGNSFAGCFARTWRIKWPGAQQAMTVLSGAPGTLANNRKHHLCLSPRPTVWLL